MPVDRVNESATNNAAQVERAAGAERNREDREADQARENREAREAQAQNERRNQSSDNEVDMTA
ncbi:MAG: hypothetical protein GF350_02770 [Chitinivibrionales bacterium]|nr:hypothetical protein [Chitinivibrionales bacterium]